MAQGLLEAQLQSEGYGRERLRVAEERGAVVHRTMIMKKPLLDISPRLWYIES